MNVLTGPSPVVLASGCIYRQIPVVFVPFKAVSSARNFSLTTSDYLVFIFPLICFSSVVTYLFLNMLL